MTIRLENVNLEHILHDVSFEIGTGITLLIGRIGAGKSTLLDVMTGLQRSSSGEVSYEGKPLWQGKRVDRDVQNSIGVVFQSPEQQLFAKTVEAEFAYSLKPLQLERGEVARRTKSAMAAMGLPEEMLGQSPLTLSGGQKRRVALGTTLAVDPRWLFLDEPTAGLDPQSTMRLVEWCERWADGREEGAMVIATHDLDAFFPIADRVLVMAGGRLVADATPQELCEQPWVLEQAGVGVPESLRTVLSLRQLGFQLPAGPLSAEELAERIAGQMEEKMRTATVVPLYVQGEVKAEAREGYEYGSVVAVGTSTFNEGTVATSSIKTRAALTDTAETSPETETVPKPLVYRLDPRGKWFFYMALSIGILMQTTWPGLLIATIFTLAVIVASQSSYRELYRVTKPFIWFLGFSVVLSGLTFQGGIGFAVDPALYTFYRVYKVLLVLILGVLLSATTGQLRMKRALEQALVPLSKFKFPVEAFALAMSIMLRFIPVILRELQRFSRITRARGRSNAKLGGLSVRDIPVLVIPLLLSILKLGEDLSLAMESRGYGSFNGRRTSSVRLQLQRSDYWTMGIGLVLLLILAVF